MDFEKIKEFIVEKKNYFIIGAVIIGVIFWVKIGDTSKSVDNSNVLSEQTEQSEQAGSFSSSSSSMSVSSSSSSEAKTITCDISGAVKHQGVYTLKNGARLQELIEAAGGAKSNAQLKAINRAVLLKDQDKIHIPYKGEKVDTATTVTSDTSSTSSGTSGNTSTSGNDGEKINLNTASAQDLQKLNGIGEKKAEQIVAYREQNGQFKKIEDLTQVSGIGEKTFAALKDQLTI